MKFPGLLPLLALAASILVSACKKEPAQSGPTSFEVPVESIDLSLPELSANGYVEITKGDILEVVAAVHPDNATDTLTWEIQYNDVAIVVYDDKEPQNHKVSIMGTNTGTTTITVSASGVEESFRVFVKEPYIPLKAIVLDVDEITITDQESVAVRCSFIPENASDTQDCTWTISDERVVEYSWEEDNEYIVDAVAPGTATLTCSIGEISASCKINVVSTYVAVTSIKADPVEVHCYERFEVPVTVLPSNATTKGFTFKIDDPEIISFEGISGMTGSFIAKKEGDTRVTVVSRDDASGKKSDFTVTVKGPKMPSGAIDMGFRSDRGFPIYFRDTNLGADSGLSVVPGFLYAWGDPTPYYYSANPYTYRVGKEDGYVLENYKWYDSSSGKYTKYTNKQDVLEAADDAANVTLGGQWYIPTLNEILCLYNYCDRKEEIRSGVHGMTFTSRIEGFQGVSIFLPCAGYINGTENFADGNFESSAGKKYYMGCYQTSNICDDDPSYFFTFDFYDGKIFIRRSERFIGESIRPIWRGYAD